MRQGLRHVTDIQDFVPTYRRKTPKMFYDYVMHGSWSEQTAQDNLNDFHQLKLRQRVGLDVGTRTIGSQMLGEDCTMPIALSPVGFTGLQSADGEIKAAQAAEEFGVPFTLSTMSVCSIEAVAAKTTKPFWFQLYVMKDRGFVSDLLARARTVGCSALMVTPDAQLPSVRFNEMKSGLANWPRLKVKTVANLMTKWSWGLGMLRTRNRSLGNVIGHINGVETLSQFANFAKNNYDPSLSWKDIASIKNEWGGKLIVKGIMNPDDAEKAINAGADAIVVSNHGGRQLDGSLSSIRALGRVVDAVNGRAEVHFDSGIRSGQDALKALALGADGVHIGRAYQYALGSYGKAGVTRALEIFRDELDLSMAMCGHTEIDGVSRSSLVIPDAFVQ